MNQELLDYLYNLKRFGMKLGLEEITKLTGVLDNPQHNFKSIHVAGTNGKGSTVSFIATILQQAEYKVGIYTSPHLVEFNERVRINNQNISNEELVRLTKIIKQKAEQNQLQPTFFEFTTALAFLYFSQQKVDYAVVEVGLGGRLDATNVIQPLVSVITSISFDHTQHLGETKLQIAAEKAAIIKENCLAVTAETNPQLITYFSQVCAEKKVPLFILDQEFSVKNRQSNLQEQQFTVTGRIGDTFKIKMLGDYQIRNALTAVLAVTLLNDKNISVEIIKKGLLQTKWSGRLEFIHENPSVLVDGAHNLEGCTKLQEFLPQIKQKIILILGISKDKQIPEMVSLIVPFAETVIITKSNFKPASLEVLETEVKKYTQNYFVCSNVKKAIQKAVQLAEKNKLILVTGSLYLVGDVLKNISLFSVK